jgi:hypothetical protein
MALATSDMRLGSSLVMWQQPQVQSWPNTRLRWTGAGPIAVVGLTDSFIATRSGTPTRTKFRQENRALIEILREDESARGSPRVDESALGWMSRTDPS